MIVDGRSGRSGSRASSEERHHLTHEEPRRGLAHDDRLGIAPDADGVLAHDGVGEAVVGGHRRPLEQRITCVGRGGIGGECIECRAAG